jgi:pyruvate kinase
MGFPREAWWQRLLQMQTADESEAIARAACSLAETLGAKALVVATQTGGTARLAAKTRPLQPILAGTTDPEAFRGLALVRGVRPMMIQPVDLLIHCSRNCTGRPRKPAS